MGPQEFLDLGEALRTDWGCDSSDIYPHQDFRFALIEQTAADDVMLLVAGLDEDDGTYATVPVRLVDRPGESLVGFVDWDLSSGGLRADVAERLATLLHGRPPGEPDFVWPDANVPYTLFGEPVVIAVDFEEDEKEPS